MTRALQSILLGTCLSLHAAGAPADAAADPAGTEPDKCDQQPEQNLPPERVQSGVHEFSCRTARWIDSWFGDSEDFREEDVGGKLTFGLSWNEYEGTDLKARYRVRTDLPNFSSRWDAFLGRVDEEAHISDTESIEETSFRQQFVDRDEAEWLLGLGYRDKKYATQGWDYSIGIRLRAPPRLYTKARYRKDWQFSPDLDLRYRQTFFWRDGIGFGTTTHLDSAFDRQGRNLHRWELVATFSEDTEGTRWWTGHTWYHNLGNKRGISLLTFARGETGEEVPLQEYGFEFTFRRQLTRDWLFVNVGPTLTWPREKLVEHREASLGFAFTVDFEFGAYHRHRR